MNKLYISLLSAILCVQQTQSMEKQLTIKTIKKDEYCKILRESKNFDTTERFINVESIRYQSDSNFPFLIFQKVDLLSLKLYNTKLNEKEIADLVKQGADVNYKEPECLYYNDTTVPTVHATNKTEQGIKNMQKLIELGAHLRYSKMQDYTPLQAAVEDNIIPMIKLLLPYEKIETPTHQEEKARAALIYYSIGNSNFEVIKMLLNLKLMTPNQALDELTTFEIASRQRIFDYLIDSGADYNKHINKVADKAFSHNNTQILNLLSKRGAFNQNVLIQMYIIKALVDSTITNLENNKPK